MGVARAGDTEAFATVSVPVASQSAADLHSALADALTQALVKISGNSNIGTVPEIKKQFRSVERLVQEYRYSDSTLQVRFDPRALVALLTEAGQPVWLSPRPVVLVLINGAPTARPAETVETVAAARGIPVLMPAETLESAAALDQAALGKMAAQYSAGAALDGALMQAPSESWIGEWLLVWRGQTWQWRSEGDSPEAAVQAAINRVADLMAEHLAVRLDQKALNNVWLAVMNISALPDYIQALRTIKELPTVMAVTVREVGSHGILLQVMISSESDQALKSALEGHPHFSPVQDTATASDVLNYRWIP